MKTYIVAIILGLSMVFAGYSDTTNQMNDAKEHLTTRFFHVKPETFLVNLRQILPPKENENNQQLMKRFFQLHSVMNKIADSFAFDSKKGILTIHASESEIEEVNKLIEQIMVYPGQHPGEK